MSFSVAPDTILRPIKFEFHDIDGEGDALAAPEEEEAISKARKGSCSKFLEILRSYISGSKGIG